MSASRKFPPPWRVEETEGGALVVRDANGFRLAYVYGRGEPGMQIDHLTPEEARKIAGLIARLPEAWRTER